MFLEGFLVAIGILIVTWAYGDDIIAFAKGNLWVAKICIPLGVITLVHLLNEYYSNAYPTSDMLSWRYLFDFPASHEESLIEFMVMATALLVGGASWQGRQEVKRSKIVDELKDILEGEDETPTDGKAASGKKA